MALAAAPALRLILTFGGSGLLMLVVTRFMGRALRGMLIDRFGKIAVPMAA